MLVEVWCISLKIIILRVFTVGTYSPSLIMYAIMVDTIIFISSVISHQSIHAGFPQWQEGVPESVYGDVWARLAGPLTADHPVVLQVLRDHYLHPPSALPYNFTKRYRDLVGAKDFSWPWIHQYLRALFSDQHKGFFVEAGALDGVYLSNTLWMEMHLGWTGLLVEPDRRSYSVLRNKHRKAWSSNTCLSSEPYPRETVLVSLTPIERSVLEVGYWWALTGNTHELRDDNPFYNQTEVRTEKSYDVVQCFPLLSYLLALNVTTVDLLSLDLQGTEQLVLRTLLDSGSVTVRVIVAENELGRMDDSYMESHGYEKVASALDNIYIMKGDPLHTRLPHATNTAHPSR